MNVYIAYSRCENDESFTLFHVETNKRRAIHHFRTVDLVDFISAGLDDTHIMVLEKTNMTKKDYLALLETSKCQQTICEGESYDILTDIFNEFPAIWCETLYVSFGYDDLDEFQTLYCQENGLKPDDDNDRDEVFDAVTSGDETVIASLKKFILTKYPVDRMVTVYITYDRYEHDEWHSISHIDNNRESAIEHYINEDLPDFVCYGPDDCHSFQLEAVVMPESLYKRLLFLDSSEGNNKELEELMTAIYQGEYEKEVILGTDGVSDFYEVLEYYCQQMGYDYDDDDERNNAQDELCGDDKKFRQLLIELNSGSC